MLTGTTRLPTIIDQKSTFNMLIHVRCHLRTLESTALRPLDLLALSLCTRLSVAVLQDDCAAHLTCALSQRSGVKNPLPCILACKQLRYEQRASEQALDTDDLNVDLEGYNWDRVIARLPITETSGGRAVDGRRGRVCVSHTYYMWSSMSMTTFSGSLNELRVDTSLPRYNFGRAS